MGKTLYLECYSGISGDMTVAALLDLGADQEVLGKVLASLPVQGFGTKISRVKKSGIDACDFDVILDAEIDGHDHDMEYLHGHEHAHAAEAAQHGKMEVHEHSQEHGHAHSHEEYSDEHEHTHEEEHDHQHSHSHEEEHSHGHTHSHEEEPNHEHVHTHDNEHEHSHNQEDHAHEHTHSHDGEHTHDHHHHHQHRGMKEIRQIIAAADMTENARKISLDIFEILAQAEAKAHNVPAEEVHFHEVGAVDSIVDILSVAVCLDNLGITDVIVPVLYEGTGTIRCQHGILPVPVPAVTNIVQQCGLDLKITQVKGELVTPTGAAIVAAVRTGKTLPENFEIEKIGIGAGKRTYECPGILRAMLIRNTEPPKAKNGQSNIEKSCAKNLGEAATDQSSDDKDVIYKLETNIDDCSGEVLGFVMERLFEAGARDVHYTPVYMKKNRPAWLLTVICKEEDVPGMEALIFAETTSIGIRKARMERTILPRRKEKVMIPFGEVEVKICGSEGAQKCYPEYESLAKICRKTGISYAEAYQMAVEASRNRG